MRPEIIRELVDSEKVKRHLDIFRDMIKIVVDIEREIIGFGGVLHADAEALLLQDGSKQENLWGANIFPSKTGDEHIEYTSLINIRPRQNRSQEIQDEEIRKKIAEIINKLIPE